MRDNKDITQISGDGSAVGNQLSAAQTRFVGARLLAKGIRSEGNGVLRWALSAPICLLMNSGAFTFASDADLVALLGGLFVAIAVLALVMDRLRSRRERLGRLDSVGWVPWTLVFLACAIIGGGLLALSLPTAIFSQ